MNVTDGPQTTYTYQSEAHNERVRYEGIDLTGQECKEVEIAVSLPGNCKEKTVTGALLISEWGIVPTTSYYQTNIFNIQLQSSSRRMPQVMISFLPTDSGKV